MSELAQLLVPLVRWHPDHGYEREWPAIERALALGVGGFVLAGGERESASTMARDLRRRSRVPLLIAADLERGAGQQFSRAIGVPPAAALGALGDVDSARVTARVTAREARQIGINWDFAPVCDLDIEAANPIVGTRAFSADPAVIAEIVAEWIDACQAEGVLACAKHFPGHGRTLGDSHSELPVVNASVDDIYENDLVPFRAAIDAGVASVMTAHVAYPSLDASGAPATLSTPILGDLLREQLAFDGLVVSDALTMEGVLARGEIAAAVGALAAGCDLLLAPTDLANVERELERARRAGRLENDRLQESLQRRLRWAQWAGDPVEVSARTVGDADVRAMAELCERVIQLVRGNVVPIASPADVIVVDDDLGAAEPSPSREPFLDTLRAMGCEPRRVDRPSPDLRSTVLIALFGDVRSWKGRAGYSAATRTHVARLCAAVSAAARDAIVVQFNHPRLAAEIPTAPIVVSAWGGECAMQEAAARWLMRRRKSTL